MQMRKQITMAKRVSNIHIYLYTKENGVPYYRRYYCEPIGNITMMDKNLLPTNVGLSSVWQ